MVAFTERGKKIKKKKSISISGNAIIKDVFNNKITVFYD